PSAGASPHPPPGSSPPRAAALPPPPPRFARHPLPARGATARANPRSTRWAPARTTNPSPIEAARARPPAAPACAAAGAREGADMPRVVGIDHLVLSVGDFARSKEFYRKLLGFLGFKLKHDYADMAGWSNGK